MHPTKSSLTLAVFTALLLLSTNLSAQNSTPGRSQSPEKPQAQSAQGMMGCCASMTATNEGMQSDMKAMDDELDRLVAAMNRAPKGNKRVDAMAAVINKLVEERKAMQMEGMQHMGEPMQMSQGSMTECPMMKGMTGK